MKQKTLCSAMEWLESLAVAVFAVLTVFVFIFKIYTVDGTSMLPTLEEPERVIVLEAFYTPKGGDIVVVDSGNAYGKTLVKRVIATEGQTVSIDENGVLTVDGAVIDSYAENCRGNTDFPVVVPEDCCFVMGDNRDVSYDSRYQEIGMISYKNIMGKVSAVFWPFSSMRVPK